MVFTNDTLTHVFIFALAVFGLWVAKHIYNHKTKNTPLVCMVGFDCHTVVHSDYARFFGIRVEILGMLYYAFTASIYLLFIFSPSLIAYAYIPSYGVYVLKYISLAALLFSAYLIAVQTFIIKKACSWCIVSAVVCILIFILTTFHYDFSFLLW